MDGVEPRFLAVHEYDCAPGELPTEEIGECLGTEWARRIVGEAKIFERAVFGWIGEQGDSAVAL